MTLIQFPDRCVSYSTFIRDLASQVALLMKHDRDDPERVCQNEAFRIFGRANVERWRKAGRLKTFKRPGKTEYLTAELRYCQRQQQDYFDNA